MSWEPLRREEYKTIKPETWNYQLDKKTLNRIQEICHEETTIALPDLDQNTPYRRTNHQLVIKHNEWWGITITRSSDKIIEPEWIEARKMNWKSIYTITTNGVVSGDFKSKLQRINWDSYDGKLSCYHWIEESDLCREIAKLLSDLENL